MTKQKHVLRYVDKPLLILSIILFLFGLVMIFSASNVTSYMNGGSAYSYFIRQAVFLVVSAIICLIIMKFNTKMYGILSHVLLFGVIAVLVLLLI